MSRQEALCHRIVRLARLLRVALHGDALSTSADLLEEAMTAVEDVRLDDADAALARLNEVRL